ncbi:MAG: hypothetical protein KGI38_00365 [Thaumarchaeota archaeon]|nr:hypothetical protein [Nitrososphaerota archaeon]
MFDPASFIRVAIFGIIYAGIEYRYVNRYEREWTRTTKEFNEKSVFWVISPYHFFLLLPLFIIASFALPITAWAGNVFFLAVLEDAVYFAWRGKFVTKGDWTTTLLGSFNIGKYEIPFWWPLDLAVAVVLYWAPL